MRIIYNSSRDFLFLDENTGALLSFSEAIKNIRPQKRDYFGYRSDGLFYATTPGKFKPIAGHYLIPPRTRWVWHDRHIEYLSEQTPFLRAKQHSKSRIHSVVRKYARSLSKGNLAVELSGGLDSALILLLLRKIGINPALIGIKSDRYEFRTERWVQNILSKGSEKIVLLDERRCFLFSDLAKTPAHPIPSPSSLFHVRLSNLALSAKTLGVDTVLTGLGGDTLFIEPIPSIGAFPNRLTSSWTFQDSWAQGAVYAPLGINHYCAYSLKEFHRLLLTLRLGEPEDRMKIWAREFFAEELPIELSKYAYKASHSGMYAESLQTQVENIVPIMKSAHEFLGVDTFKSDSARRIIENWARLDQKVQQRFFADLSFAVWLATLK